MKKIIIIVSGLLIIFVLVSIIMTKIVYDKQFPRFDRIDDTVHAHIRYSDIKDDYPRETFTFLSGKHNLKGYLYTHDDPLGLVVIAHGLGGGADIYLPYTTYFIDHGFSVFMYDATGSFDSEGATTKGFPQSLIDLENALTYIKSHDVLSTLDLFLLGHSWGGYAVANALHFDFDIKAVVSIAAPYNAHAMIYEQTKKMLGFFSITQKPFLKLYENYLFNKYASFDAMTAINQSDAHVMIIHGVNDQTIDFYGSAIINQKDSITSQNVVYVTRDQANQSGHNDLMRSMNSIAYLEAINASYTNLYELHNQSIPYEIMQAFYETLDRFLIQELDDLLMQEIIAFYLQA